MYYCNNKHTYIDDYLEIRENKEILNISNMIGNSVTRR